MQSSDDRVLGKPETLGAEYGPWTPPSEAEQRAYAAELGPMDAEGLRQLAQYAVQQQKSGEWHYGFVTSERLLRLAEQLELAELIEEQLDEQAMDEMEALALEPDAEVELTFVYVDVDVRGALTPEQALALALRLGDDEG